MRVPGTLPPDVKRRAFTLVEMLVVIAILVVLISILLPALQGVRAKSKELACGSNLHQLALAFMMFSGEHDGYLPGNKDDASSPDTWKRCWLMGNTFNFYNAPDQGTIYPYVGSSKKVYRCPALPVNPGGGDGYSNGRFDYSVFEVFTGAKQEKMPRVARFTYADGTQVVVAAPLMVEESGTYLFNNSAYAPTGGFHGWWEGGHSGPDKMASNHRGGSNYVSADGSVQWFLEPAGRDCNNWEAQTRGGTWVNIGQNESSWGWWNNK